MVKKIDELNALRALVRKTRSAVTAKENRIKKNSGIDIRGTAQDPRRPINVVDQYNRKELNTYLADLKAFMSRNSGFLYGANNAVISKDRFLQYKKLEKQFNEVGAKQFKDIADVFIPHLGMTVRQRENVKPDAIFAQGEIVQKPFSIINRNPNNIANDESMDKLTKSLTDKLKPNYFNSQLAAGKSQLKQMLKTIGNPELTKMVNKLSNRQFDILWNHTDFASQVSGTYYVIAAKSSGSEDKWYSTVIEDHSNDIREILEWAASIEATGDTISKASIQTVNSGKKKTTGKR